MLHKILVLVTLFVSVAAVPVLQPDESVDMKLSQLEKRVQALSIDTTGVDAPPKMVKSFSDGLFESCAAVREAGKCSHPMAAKHCAASCAAAKTLRAESRGQNFSHSKKPICCPDSCGESCGFGACCR